MPILLAGAAVLVLGLTLYNATKKPEFLFFGGVGPGLIIGAIVGSIFCFT